MRILVPDFSSGTQIELGKRRSIPAIRSIGVTQEVHLEQMGTSPKHKQPSNTAKIVAMKMDDHKSLFGGPKIASALITPSRRVNQVASRFDVLTLNAELGDQLSWPITQ